MSDETTPQYDWLQGCLATATERVERLKNELKEANREEGAWQALLKEAQGGLWCHVLATMERQKDFFHCLRTEEHPVIPQLEDLFRQAKSEVEDAMFSLPRDMERVVERLELPLDKVQSRHPKYFFRDGFLTVEIAEKKHLAKISTYEGKLAEFPADIAAIEERLAKENDRLFNRKFDGKKFLKQLRTAYLAVLKKEKRKDGEEVPLRQVMTQLAKKKNSGFKRDEFVLNLSWLTEKGPASVDGKKFQLQQTKDSSQGVLLYGPSARGMVNLLVFSKEKP
jgi:hypothetical protein